MLEAVELSRLEAAPTWAQLADHRVSRHQEGPGEAVASLLLVDVLGEPPVEHQVAKLVGHREALPVSRPVAPNHDERVSAHRGREAVELPGAVRGREHQEAALLERVGQARDGVVPEAPRLAHRERGELDLLHGPDLAWDLHRDDEVGHGR